MGSINYSQAIKPDTAYITKIIENSLLSDWAISIEYLSNDPETTHWQLWDKAFFAIRSAKPVITALADCCEKHSKSVIRIAAEKLRPQSRILYTVYDPRFLPDETVFKLKTMSSKSLREIEPFYAQIGLRT